MLFTRAGVGGLNPWCEGRECTGVSNLSGLIAWAAGVVLWITSIERVRRSHYLRFFQAHQLQCASTHPKGMLSCWARRRGGRRGACANI